MFIFSPEFLDLHSFQKHFVVLNVLFFLEFPLMIKITILLLELQSVNQSMEGFWFII